MKRRMSPEMWARELRGLTPFQIAGKIIGNLEGYRQNALRVADDIDHLAEIIEGLTRKKEDLE